MLLIENLLGDLRNAARTIRRMPGLAAVTVVSLAVGMGVNTTIFSRVHLILFEPMPAVSGAANFLLVEPRTETGGYPGASWLEYRDLQTRAPALRDIVASQMVPFNVGERGPTERTHGQLVSGNYFSALGLKPAVGGFALSPLTAILLDFPVISVADKKLTASLNPLDATLTKNAGWRCSSHFVTPPALSKASLQPCAIIALLPLLCRRKRARNDRANPRRRQNPRPNFR